MSTTTSTPHDALFKAAFSSPENAAAELRHVLGPIADLIDLSTLAPCSPSFVTDALRARHADLLFTARAAEHELLLYILYEHKSGPEPMLPLSLLGTKVQIWEAWLREHPNARQLPIIIPVVVAHAEGGWRASPAFEALFAAPEALMEFVPRFRFALDDLGSTDPEALKRRETSPFARLALLALRQARRAAIGRLVRDWLDLLRELRRQPSGRRAESQIFQYLFEVCGADVDADAIDTTATDLDPEAKEIMETYAQKWLREGRESGLQEGRQAGRQEGRQEGVSTTLLRILHRRFGGVPAAVERRVQTADASLLEQWIDRCFVARSLDEVFT